jgi:hypothetical protein
LQPNRCIKQINLDEFKEDSKKLINYIKNKDTKEIEDYFELYETKYRTGINDDKSKLYFALPFLKSVEEYLFDPLAREKGFASIEEIESLFEDDVLGIK